MAKAQVYELDAALEINYEYRSVQDSLIEHLRNNITECQNYGSDLEQVLTDQISANNRLKSEVRKQKRWTVVVGSILLGALVLTNM